ncbi:MAG: hypothetical protein K2R98_16435 [Gemmataceae bacterium]|nr:hypothetical protein [Gemmataceae bacterium]
MKPHFPRSDERGQLRLLTFSRFVAAPENRAALVAVQTAATCMSSRKSARTINPLYLHGPAGTGKTHLIWALAQETARRNPELTSQVVPAADLARCDEDMLHAVRDCDLVVIEDVQQLAPIAAERLTQLFDTLLARHQQLVFTANVGPRFLDVPARLISRLASGLVVSLEALSAPSRLAFLCDRAQRRQLVVEQAILAWLAEHLAGGGRQLQGALAQLEGLLKQNPRPLDVPTVAAHFREQVEATVPTLERIARRVGEHFQVDARQLQSRRRSHQVMLPRQVSMYLARQLTGLSLQEIGAYFGGRDHSTVLHACRKVEGCFDADAALQGTLRQLRADLA